MITDQTTKPQEFYQGQFTFYGIFKTFHDDCETMYRNNGWAATTDEQYEKIIINTICPHLLNHDTKGIIEYTLEDYESALSRIQASYIQQTGNAYGESTVKTFRRLISTVSKVAYENHKTFVDVFATNDQNRNTREKWLQYHNSRNIMPKSLSPEEEHQLTKYLIEHIREDGTFLGLLLILATGTRPGEICGANFEDIVVFPEYPDFYCLRILHATIKNSSQRKIIGKTRNFYRYIPISKGIYEIIQALFQERTASLASNPEYNEADAKRLPLVCKGTHYLRRCGANDLSRAGRNAFLAIGMRSEYLTSIELHLQEENSRASELSPEIRFNKAKEDPTTYLLRRNYATHLRLLSLADTEVQYLMAHKIDDPTVKRRDYSNPDYLYPIKQKLDLRPIMNPIPHTLPATVLSNNQTIAFSCDSTQSFLIPSHTYGIINVFPGIPNAQITYEISPPHTSNIHISNISRNDSSNVVTDNDVGLSEYWNDYLRVIGDYVVHI